MSIVQKLIRRKVFRVAIAYAVIAGLLLQVSDVLVPVLHLPDWFQFGLALLLILGLPVVLIYSWVNEPTLGIEKEGSVASVEYESTRIKDSEDNFVGFPVYYATDRARFNWQKPPNRVFSGGRCKNGELRFGKCLVSVPDRPKGELPRPSWVTLQFTENPKKHVVIQSQDDLDQANFVAELKARLKQSEQTDALVFIHGYNVKFSAAVRRTAQLTRDLEFLGPSILYSWPSLGFTLAYSIDDGNAQWSSAHMAGFITLIRSKLGASCIHIIAHSMGNQPLMNALKDVCAGKQDKEDARIKQVIMAAPDVDAERFVDLAKHFSTDVGRVTLYASSKDYALKWSKRFRWYQRAGQTVPSVTITKNVDTIDASAVKTEILGHSYIGDNRSIIRDVHDMIRHNESPNNRFGMVKKTQSGSRFWFYQP